MNKNLRLLGCGLAGLILLALLVMGGAWWYLRSQSPAAGGTPESAVQVFLLSPASGDELAAGDFVPVSLQATAPEKITSSELFVDGQSLGAVSDSPQRASWTWQAWPPGVHTLSAHATAADGQVGQSQTVIVNVLALSDTIRTFAGPGETLAQVGDKFGVPPDQMAGANPQDDPSKPLKDGQPVNVPTGGGAGGAPPQPPGGGGNGGGAGFPLKITWELKLTKPVDKSYCYLSTGDGIWDKIPQPPFNFFESLDNLYTQLFDAIPPQPITIQAQCWGWLGGTLDFLGDGQTKFDPGKPGEKLLLNGQAFQLIGMPQSNGPQADILTPQVTAPYALREPADVAECSAHGDPPVPNLCNIEMNAPLKQYIILIWEWQPGINWPTGLGWINDIKGYHVYEIDPSNNSKKYMKDAVPVDKFAALPLPWGAKCYGVEAYADAPQFGGTLVSKMATYCVGQPPPTQKVTLTPSNWLTGGGDWINEDCGSEQPHNEFGQEPTVEVGSYVWYYEGGCIEQGQFGAAVQFPETALPPGAIIQKATLSFKKVIMEWTAAGVALEPAPQTCVSSVGTAKQDWSGLGNANHFSSKDPSAVAYFTPFISMSPYSPPSVDVTQVVLNWAQQPGTNHGFILTPAAAPSPHEGYGACLSALGNFQLEIDFFAP